MKYRIIVFICLICLIGIGFVSQPKPVAAAGNTYYVATTGKDSNPGTLAQPWLTPQHAANVMVAGDTCYIEAGTYGSSGNGQRIITENNGSAGNYITFENYNNATVTIYSYGLYDNLDLSNSYIQFIGLRCIGDGNPNGSYAGAAITSPVSNIIIQNCYFSGFQVGGIYMDNSNDRSNITINGCTFYQCNTTNNMECIDVNNTSNFVIENCVISNPVYPTARGAISTTGASNGSIHNNIIHDVSGVGIYIGNSPGHPGSNVSIYDNLVYNCGQAGLNWSDELGLGQITTGISFYNNIVYNCHGGFEVDYYPGLGTVNFSVINNTFYNNGTLREILIVPTHAYLNSCVIENNILDNATGNDYAIDYSDYSKGGITIDHNLYYNSAGFWNPSSAFGTNYVKSNPLLTNPTSDFSLQSGSPAIDAGSSNGAPAADYIGTSRPQSAGYDIGAYEYQTTAGSTPTVATSAASGITTNAATLNGSLTALGSSSPVSVSFDWGTDTSYTGGNIAATPSSITAVPTTFFASLSGLTAGTTYHYRAKAVGTTTVYGSDQQFTTSNTPAPLAITTNTLQNGNVGLAYSQTLAATGGTAPYNWTITAGTLPPGLSLNSSGVISGIPTTAVSQTSVTFQVTDSKNLTATTSLTISVAYSVWDVNMDGTVNVLDIILITQNYSETGTPGWIREDVNNDGVINVLDAILVGQHTN